MCPEGFAGRGCATATSTVSLEQTSLTVVEPSRGVVEITIAFPLTRTIADVEVTALELMIDRKGGAGPTTASPVLKRELETCAASLDAASVCAAALESAASTSEATADFELIGPFDRVVWTSAVSGTIAATVRLPNSEPHQEPPVLKPHGPVVGDQILKPHGPGEG